MSKRKILVFSDWYLPAYTAGGPVRSIANIVSHLGDEFDFRIVCSDRDLNASRAHSGIKYGEWNQVGKALVRYLAPHEEKYTVLKQIMFAEQADVFYLNSLFSKKYTIYPLLIRQKFLRTRKTVLAPRGMLGGGALEIKPVKKKTFIFLSRLFGLFRSITWQASTEHEGREIQSAFGKRSRIQIATNLSAPLITPLPQRVKKEGELTMFFLSRISSKKNLLHTLQLLKKVSPEYKIMFDIYGPVEDDSYWEDCLRAMNDLPAKLSCQYRGSIANEEVKQKMSGYHLHLLLTRNENFGHSIVESLSLGCLQILSNQTPWNHLAQAGAGWICPLNDEAAFLHAIREAALLNQEDYDQMSKNAYTFAEKIINNPSILDQNRSLFQ